MATRSKDATWGAPEGCTRGAPGHTTRSKKLITCLLGAGVPLALLLVTRSY